MKGQALEFGVAVLLKGAGHSVGKQTLNSLLGVEVNGRE